MGAIIVQSSPSLALIKYWGKMQKSTNLPATSSLGITLNDLVTTTRIKPDVEKNSVIIDGMENHEDKMQRYLAFLKQELQLKGFFAVESSNNFPAGSGLASSSSGYAALALGFSMLSRQKQTRQHISSLAQVGSGSAARSIYDGFTIMEAGRNHAEELYDADYWPDLRVIICMISRNAKEISSTTAMNRVRDTSVYYNNWLDSSTELFNTGLAALENKDLETLGNVMQRSYKQMFATMLGADPPILYWLPASIELLHLCQSLRKQGIGAWETMDAGPQVKILCLESELPQILSPLRKLLDENQIIVTKPGKGARVIEEPDFQVSAVS